MIKKVFRFIGKAILYFFAASIIGVLVFRFIPIPFTSLMIIRCAQQKIAGKEVRMYKKWKSLENISSKLSLAVVASEDQNYLEHDGFDVKAIEDAMKYNERHKKKKGASTISQQTAKNVFLWPSRSWVRKGFEVYFTFLIEKLWSKERIMEVYLNVIEMGDGIYGAEAASQAYFNKSAKNISASQAALIAAILPNPVKWKLSNPPAFIYAKQRWILQQMNNLGGQLEYETK